MKMRCLITLAVQLFIFQPVLCLMEMHYMINLAVQLFIFQPVLCSKENW